MNYIELKQVSKKFGSKEVLKNITLTVEKGEILGLLGPSGAGKTTLIKVLSGQLNYQGNASIFGVPCDGLKKENFSDIGIVFDESGLYERLSCMDNMMLFARMHQVSKKEVKSILERVKLTDYHTITGKLSKGMKQRLVLARAILHKPKILFLDEPTSGLDPKTARQIHELLKELKERGTTIFLTTHNMEEAHKLCDHVALLNEGVIVEYGEPEVICRKYNSKKKITLLCRSGESITLLHTPETLKEIASYFEQDNVETVHTSEPNLETVFLELTGRMLMQEARLSGN